MPDGKLGLLEAGYDSTLWTRFTPLDYKLHQYPGTIWVRQRLYPANAGTRYPTHGVCGRGCRTSGIPCGSSRLQATQLSPRGLFRTSHSPPGAGVKNGTCAPKLFLNARFTRA